jgi:single-strand DNA-binding protein
MSGSLNKVTLIGNLGKDPEIRFTQDNSKVASFSIATSENWKDKSTGERKDKTEWHRVVVFNQGLCEVIEKYVKKGSKLYLEGALQTRKWNDASGQEKYVTEVVLGRFSGTLIMLDAKDAGGATSAGEPSWDAASSSDASASHSLDDEIPF